MVIKVDKSTMESFLPLMPRKMRDYVENGEGFCLGSVRDETAAGILVFTVGDGVNDMAEPVSLIELHWIYTAEGFRNRGVAAELMEALYDVLSDTPGAVIVCDIPQGMGYDGAEAFLASYGFEFEKNDIPLMIISKEDFRKIIKENNKEDLLYAGRRPKKPEGLIPVSEIPRLRFKRTLKTMLSDEEFKYYKNISEDRDSYDPGISFAIMQGDEISSMVLFKRTRSDELQMVMLDAASGTDPKEMRKLLRYAAACYFLDEPEDVTVRLSLWKDKSKKLAAYFFPQKETLFVRRGYQTEERK